MFALRCESRHKMDEFPKNCIYFELETKDWFLFCEFCKYFFHL
jgi:hypothetical protein